MKTPRGDKTLSSPIMQAACSYVGAHVAHRDAMRLIDIGLVAAIDESSKVLSREPKTLDEAIELVAGKEAMDLIDLYGRDPQDYPDGRTAESALAKALKMAKQRYSRGRCGLCKGPALPCAKRHARGRSCA